MLHALAGCAFFGAFSVKMLVLTRSGPAGWVLPLAGCSTFGDEPADPPASAAPGGSAAAEGAGPLATVSEVPVGGGVIRGEVVLTQPAEGTIKAFSSACTHQGCAVTKITGTEITCPCHGSAFAIADGAPTQGPATKPLAEIPVTVEGDDISLA